ncbi:uncharacterized protein LOC132267021 [Cornus florida]|uniref:uncharacterized protein LOC132267021 n=1 Tax=Cornus florida TaxID=4283 RepID=UPI0028A241F6|nr:uncharacterized protein LOC132267021 [Cornus florida]
MCDWWNIGNPRTGIHCDQHTTSVNFSSKWYNNDPYVLASQAKQVFYMKDPKCGGQWHVVQRVDPRSLYHIEEKLSEDESIDMDTNEYEVGDSRNTNVTVQDDDRAFESLHREDDDPAYVNATIVWAENATVNHVYEDFINDDSQVTKFSKLDQQFLALQTSSMGATCST